jgi:hypothetical protein
MSYITYDMLYITIIDNWFTYICNNITEFGEKITEHSNIYYRQH